jgi:hypothetical protein
MVKSQIALEVKVRMVESVQSFEDFDRPLQVVVHVSRSDKDLSDAPLVEKLDFLGNLRW